MEDGNIQDDVQRINGGWDKENQVMRIYHIRIGTMLGEFFRLWSTAPFSPRRRQPDKAIVRTGVLSFYFPEFEIS